MAYAHNYPGLTRYHRDIGFPKGFVPPSEVVPLRYSGHAVREANKYTHPIPLRPEIEATPAKLIEAWFDEAGKLAIAVWRCHFSATSDVCLVVDVRTYSVITIWKNAKTDEHRTLDTSLYAKP